MRIGNHKQAETKRLEAERERIRSEEAAKLQREHAAQAKAQQEAEAQAAATAQAAIAQASAAKTEAPQACADVLSAPSIKQHQSQQALAATETVATETLTLGQLNAILAPIKLDAAGLEELGIEFTKERGAVRLPANAVQQVITKMVSHLKDLLVKA